MTNQLSLDIEVLEPLLLMSASPLAEGAADADVIVAEGDGDLAQGTDAAEVLRGDGGNNVLRGGGGDDLLIPVSGDNVLEGEDGNDTAVYPGSRADYEVEDRGFGIAAVGRGSNVDFLTSVENIQFADGTFSVEELVDGKPEFVAEPAESSAAPELGSAVPSDVAPPIVFAEAPSDAASSEAAESLAPEPAEPAPEPIISETPFAVDGGETATLEGNRADYSFEDQGFGIVAVRTGDSIDFLTSVDTVEFKDGTFSISELLPSALSIVDAPENDLGEIAETGVNDPVEDNAPTVENEVETTDVAAVPDTAPEYPGPQVVYNFDVAEPPGSDAAGDIEKVSTSFNETTNEFSFRVVMTDADGDAQTKGFTLAINDGPNPKGNGDEMALFYFDNSGSEPVITAYNYNGQNDFSSWQDAPIVSSLASNSPFTSIEASTNADGEVVYSFSMDATSVVEFSNGSSWTGVSFGESLGIWLHPQTNVSSSYNADGYLESWSYDSHGWYDTKDRDTVTAIIDPPPPEPPVVVDPPTPEPPVVVDPPPPEPPVVVDPPAPEPPIDDCPEHTEPQPPANGVPTANKDSNVVRVNVDTPVEPVEPPEPKSVQDVDTPTDGGAVQLKMMEGGNTIFNFDTTADVLSEDVWFAGEGDFNEGPVAGDDTFTVEADETVSGSLFGNDSDPDGDTFVVSAVNGSSDGVNQPIAGSNGGTFVIDADGNAKFTPDDSFADLQPGESAQTSVTYTIDDGNGGTDTATVTVLITGDEDTAPVCVKEQSRIIRGAYNGGRGQEVTINLSDSVMDADGDNLSYDLNFADSFFVEGTEKGKFGWEVKSFDADTGELKLQIYTEKAEAWHYDAAEVSDVFVKATEDKRGANWESGSAYQPFSFSVADEDGNQIDCAFKLQVFDQDYNSPIALDLNGDGEIGVTGETTSKDKSGISQVGQTVDFDIDNDGTDDKTEWFAGDGDGILVDNRDGNAANDMDGGRLFGDEGGKYANGYEKLAELDTDGDGSLTGSELEGLEVWVDDGDAVAEDGEFRSLQDLGIFKLNTNMTLVQDADGRDLMQSTASVDAEAAGAVEYSISGADSALFEINDATGEMCFKQSPDYENPLDSDGDNVYQVVLERTIDGVTSSQTVEIAICDKVADNSTPPTASATGNVLANDTDPNGDDLTAALVDGPQNGSVSLSSDGDYVYTPNPGFTGIDVFTYEVSDGNGGTDTAEVCIEVIPDDAPEPPPVPENNAPDAVNDSTSTTVDVSVSGTVADNDSDLDGDTLTFSVKEPALNGAVALSDDGSYTYTPNAGFVGFDTFRYEVSDGNGGTDIAIVLIEIEPPVVVDPPVVDPPVVDPPVVDPPVVDPPVVDPPVVDPPVVDPPVVDPPVVDPPVVDPPVVDPPVVDPPVVDPPVVDPPVVDPPDCDPPAPENQNPDAIDDNADTPYGTTISGNVLTNDVDPDGDSLSVKLMTPPANGVAVVGPDGQYNYTPNAGFSGRDVFVYQVDDGNGGTDTATVTIEVADGACGVVNGGPAAEDDSNTTTEDTPVSGSVAGNDVDPDGDALKFYVEQGPTDGSIEFNEDGTYTYTPDPGFFGTDTFTYEANDGRGGTSIATVTITVEEVPNLAPVAEDDTNTTTADSDVDGSVADNDSDPDGDNLTFYIEQGPSNGSIVFNTDGTYTYTPDPGYVGTDTFTYEANDGNGGTAIATVTVTVEPGQNQCNGPLTPPNEAPEAAMDINDTTFNTPVSGNVLPNDVDADGDTLTVTLTSQPTNGTVTLTADGDYTYTPNNDFEGEDVFTYEISDGNGGTDTAEVRITVTRDTIVSPDDGDREFDTTYVNSGADGLIWGDPHFRGDDGGFYDVSGEAGSYYNLLSDSDLQVNAKFIDWKDSNTDEKGTVIGELGVTLGGDQLRVDFYGARLNGFQIPTDQETAIGTGGTITYDGTVTTVDTGEYKLTFTRQDGLFAVRIKVNNPFSDLVAPHGLWGQTVDADAEARDGDYYKDNYVYGLQGGGALDTVDNNGDVVRSERGDDTSFRLYETSDLFSLTALYDDGSGFFRYDAETGTGLNRLS